MNESSQVDAPHGPAEAHRTPLERLVALVRRVIGAPDYESYLRHMAECHPDRAPLTEDEFLDERLQARYSRPGQRCC